MTDRLLSKDVLLARERLAELGSWYRVRPAGSSGAELDELIAADAELGRVARLARLGLIGDVEWRAGTFSPALLTALVDIPRERFVLPEDIGESAVDTPLSLDDEGLATISAPHAYLLSFRVLGLRAGDKLVELGTGSGYGAALASHVVTESGRVLTVEIDEALSSRAQRLLRGYPNVRAMRSDAVADARVWAESAFHHVHVTFAVRSIPDAWLAALPEGGRLIAPVGREETQQLLRVERVGGELRWSEHGPVRYVPNRSRVTAPAGPSLR